MVETVGTDLSMHGELRSFLQWITLSYTHTYYYVVVRDSTCSNKNR